MKKIVFLFLTTLLLIPVYGQFQHSYGTEKSEIGQSVRTTYFDNGYIIGGFSNYGFIYNTDATLLKTDKEGNILWAKQYGEEANDGFYSVRPILPKDDKGYVCLGYTNSYGFGSNDFFFVKTDPNGNAIEFRTYGGEKNDIGQCIQVINDEEAGRQALIMIGTSYSWANSAKMFIVKAKENGDIVRSAIVGNIGNQYGNWIEQTKDGGFIAVGMSNLTYGSKVPTSYYDIFVVKLKADLNIEWARTIGGGPDRPYNDVAYSVKELEKGYIITGYTRSFGVRNSYDAFLLKLYPDGGLQWLRNYGNTSTDIAYDVLNEENTSMNHQYVLTGYTYINNSIDAMLLATSYNGNVMWAQGYGLESTDVAYELDRNQIPGYVFTGFESSFGVQPRDIYHVVTKDVGSSNCPQCETKPIIYSSYQKPYIRMGAWSEPLGKPMKVFKPWEVKGDYKTVPCGEKLKSADSELSTINSKESNQTGLQAYPNPANTFIEIKYAEKFRNGKLVVYNSTGQMVINETLPEQDMTTLLLDGMKNGIYMLNISNNNGDSETTKIIIAK
jgi:hypothetical protein